MADDDTSRRFRRRAKRKIINGVIGLALTVFSGLSGYAAAEFDDDDDCEQVEVDD